MKAFELLPTLTARARHSKVMLRLLNVLLGRMIPFNRPHGFGLLEIGADFVKTTGPYRRSNHNHVRGIHACGIATVAEFSAGFLLLTKLDPARYRLIMARIEVDYLYQAKKRIISESSLSAERISREIEQPLRQQESVSIRMVSRVCDESGNEIALAHTTWQIKRWDRVRTAL